MVILKWTGVALVATLLTTLAVFAVDMSRAHRRVSVGSAVVPTPFGDVEVAEGGSGPDVLVVHGSGGGFDQGALVAEAVLGDGVHWIAPSRFGYLRSALPTGATWDDQADAYAALLDHLGVDTVAVVAFSQGGPSALLFAALYPERVSSLTLVSCGVASQSDREQADASQQGNALARVFQSDLLYWALSTFGERQLMGLMGATDEVVADLTPDQRALVHRVIDGMNPVSLRSAGVTLDNRAAMPNERIAAIRAPTLVVHATDDTLQLFGNAEFAAATIPGARLVQFERGGHLLFAVEQDAIRGEVRRFVAAHVDPS